LLLVALTLTAIVIWVQSRRLRTGRPLGEVNISGRPPEARLSTQEAILIAESACRATAANPTHFKIGSVHFSKGGLWWIPFENIPPSPGGPLILIDDGTKKSLLIPGE